MSSLSLRVETASGRAEYVRHQRDFAERAATLRQRLRAECDRLLALVDGEREPYSTTVRPSFRRLSGPVGRRRV